MSLIERVLNTVVHQRDTDALDAPIADRTVVYTDTSGVQTGKYGRQVRLYNNSGGTLAKGQIAMVDYKGAPATSPQVIAPATNTPQREIVVAGESVANLAWGWFFIAGWCDALVNGTTDVAIGDYLKVTTGTSTTAFIKDSSTTYSVGTAAVAGAASTANSDNTTLVELIGGRVTVA